MLPLLGKCFHIFGPHCRCHHLQKVFPGHSEVVFTDTLYPITQFNALILLFPVIYTSLFLFSSLRSQESYSLLPPHILAQSILQRLGQLESPDLNPGIFLRGSEGLLSCALPMGLGVHKAKGIFLLSAHCPLFYMTL